MEITLKLKDGMLVTEATAEAMQALGLTEGTKLEVVRTSRGLRLMPEDVAAQFRVARKVMDENHDVLRRLAQ